MASYVERHISFGVDEFEGLWKLQFLHPFFFGDSRRTVTVYIVPPNSDFSDSEYKGIEVVEAGPHIQTVIAQLLPRITKYPYRWELNSKKLDTFGYDLVTGMTKTGTSVGTIDFTDIAFEEIKRYYEFTDGMPAPDIVIEDERIVRDGALVKLKITLEKAQWANQLSFDFFSSYPIEVASIMYQEDTSKYASTYEIPLQGVQQSATSLSITFPSVFAKQFTIIIAQCNYTISNSAKSIKAAQVALNTNQKNQAATTAAELIAYNTAAYLDETYDELWADDTIAYQKNTMENSSGSGTTKINSSSSEWRTEYQEARNALTAQAQSYEEQLKAYEEAETKYKKDMEEYVRYQQQLADWYGKWG